METRKRKGSSGRQQQSQSEPTPDPDVQQKSSPRSRSGRGAIKEKDDKAQLQPQTPPSSSAATPSPPADGELIGKAPIYGPMPAVSKHRLWSRTMLILGVLTVIYFQTNKSIKESVFASYEEKYPGRAFETKCSPAYDQNIAAFLDCRPKKCSRLITDEILLPSEILQLQDLARRTLEYDSKLRSLFAVYDLTSGKLSFQDRTIDLVKLNSTSANSRIFKHGDLNQFQVLEAKLKHVIGDHFNLPNYKQSLFLAKPAFFARLTAQGKGSDSYSSVKVDQTNYNAFHYSVVVFLSDFGKDFEGGRFIFPDGDFTNRTVEARAGRALIYTSGLENKNYIERVSKGSQIILTIGFTCDLSHSIKKPRLT